MIIQFRTELVQSKNRLKTSLTCKDDLLLTSEQTISVGGMAATRQNVQGLASNSFARYNTQEPQQYFHFYNNLFRELTPLIQQNIRKHGRRLLKLRPILCCSLWWNHRLKNLRSFCSVWDSSVKIVKDLQNAPRRVKIAACGLICKEMSMRPSVLDKFSSVTVLKQNEFCNFVVFGFCMSFLLKDFQQCLYRLCCTFREDPQA